MFKTLYSRYGNVKSGKFVAGAGDEENTEEFEALNDIEKVLNKIGISMRDTSAEFRNFDDVLAEIAAKWATLSDVERNAISTAFAGTRQREVFNVLMENFDEVDKFERIAESSAGSTAQKMDIYSDSLEASKNRVTAATEELTQNIFGGNLDDVLKTWNDQLAYIIKNGKTLITQFALLTIVMKGLVSGSMFGGLAKIMQSILVSAASFRSTMATVGTNLYNSPIMGLGFRGLSKVTTPIGNGITNMATKVSGSKVGQAVANKTQQASVWFGQTGVGKSLGELRTNTVNQIRDTNVGKLYTAAYKAGVSGNMDAIQADKSAQFISSLQKDPKMFAKFNSLSADSQQKVLNSLSQDKNLIDQSGITSHLTNIENILNTIATNTSMDDQRYGELKNKYGTDSKGRIQFKKGAKTNGISDKEMEDDKKFAEQYLKTKKAEMKASEKATTADLKEENASYRALNADEKEAYGSLKAAAQDQGMTGDDISRTGAIMQDKGVREQYEKTSKFSGLGSSLMGVGSMAAMMGGTIGGQAAAQNSGREWTSYTGMGAGMLMSAGLSMGWNPAGWAMMAGGAILGIATLIGGLTKTSEKIQEEAEEARSKLSEGANELKELASEIENLKKQSSSFNKLASGVDPETGENVTLSDEEFGQYQDQLKEIINARDELYASYNKEGDLIAMKNGEIIKSNELMKEAIELAKEEERLKAAELSQDNKRRAEVATSAKGYSVKIEYNQSELENLEFATDDGTVSAKDYADKMYSKIAEGNGRFVVGTANKSHDLYYMPHGAQKPSVYEGTVYYDKANQRYISEDGYALFVNNGDIGSEQFNNPGILDHSTYTVEMANGEQEVVNTKAEAVISKAYNDYRMGKITQSEFVSAIATSGADAEYLSNYLGLTQSEAETLLDGKVVDAIEQITEDSEAFYKLIGSSLTTELNYAAQAVKGYSDLSDRHQSLVNNITSGLRLPNLTETQIEEYQEIITDITKKLVEDKNLQLRVDSYNAETAVQGSYSDRNNPKNGTAQYNLETFKELYGGYDNKGNVTDAVYRQMYINAGFEFIDDKVVTKQEYLAYKLSEQGKNALGYNTTGEWRNYTESELSTMYENYDLVINDEEVKSQKKEGESDEDYNTRKQNAIKRRIQEINMESYSVQQLFGVLESDINRIAKEEGILFGGTLSDGVEKFNGKLKESSEAYNKLSQMAERLGVKSVEALAKMSKGLKLDQFGYSTQSMTEIKESFQQLQDIRNKLSSEGTMEAEDWDYLAENFSGILSQATADDMIKAMDEALEAKEFQIRAEILGTFAEDNDLFKKFASGLTEGIQSDTNIFNLLSGTSNFKQMQGLWSAIDLAGGDVGLEKKQIAKAFGIDTNDTDWEKILTNTLKQNYGQDMTYDAFITTLKYMNSDGFNLSSVWENYTKLLADAQMQLQKIQQDNEAFSNDLNKINTQYQQGALSADDYLSKLKALQNDSRASAEQLRELAESIEEVTFSQLNAQFEKGAISAKKYREEVTKLMSQNAIGSDDWNQQLQSYLSSFDSQIKLLSNDLEMLDDTDFAGMKRISNEKITISQQKLAAIEAAGIVQYGDSYDRETDPQWKAAQVELLQTYQAASQIIDQEKTYWQQQYERGYIGRDDLRQHLVDLSNETNITQEQFEQLNEQIEELDFGKLQELFEGGEMSGADYRKELSLLMKKQDMDSEQYKQYRKSFLGSFDQELGISEAKQALLGEHDYFNRDAFLGEDINILKAQAAALEAAGLEESEQYYTTIGKIVDKEKERVELKKEQLEYEISLAEEVMDAYTNILNYGMEELQNRQKDINDMYDDEISKLQDINDQKKRSIELTKLQQELENAKKEKTRVYQAGVGFVYQENKAKVKEAKQNLENYLDERKIQDLQFAQKQQNKLIQDQIDRLQDISDYISEIKSTATATASVMDLIKNGVVPPGTTIDQAIKQINNEAINGEDGKIASLGVKFDGFASDYTTKSELLNGYMDELESKLAKISDTYMTYENDKALVEGFSSQLWSDYNTEVKPDRQTFEQTIQDFINGKGTGYTKWKDDITKAFSDNKPVVNVSSGNNVDLSEIERQLRDANLYLKGTMNIEGISLNETLTNVGMFRDYKGFTQDRKYLRIGNRYYDATGVETIVASNGTKHYNILKGTLSFTKEQLDSSGYTGYSSGIENGPVTYTGLAMLHGSPSSPEYVLNSDQAGTLLKNLATMTMSPYQAPKVDSYNRGEGSTVYQFTGDLNLPNVQRPDQFFNELLKEANVQFPTIKRNYL